MKQQSPRITGGPANRFTEIQSKAPDADFFAALRRARREHPEVLEGLKREQSARSWEVVRRRVSGPINLAEPVDDRLCAWRAA